MDGISCYELGIETYRQRKYYEAIEYFTKALTFKIDDKTMISNIYNEIAICQINKGDTSKGLLNLDLAILANHQNYVAIENRAGLRISLKRDEREAIEDFQILIDNSRMTPSLWRSWELVLKT